MKKLEEKLGYTFRNRELLLHAMTHSSYANEHRGTGLTSNERLEFLATRYWVWWWRTICSGPIPICRRES